MGVVKRIGTPLSACATRVMLLGCGELGKEVIIALQRLGCEVIGVDRYADAPGMQVAHRSHVVTMTDGAALRALIERKSPTWWCPRSRPSPLRCWSRWSATAWPGTARNSSPPRAPRN
jgi:formate-dependent phosphoribosylglycinamide formyltransferase (GAR transformylase)